jgi:DNA-binding Lrp family transcriptional regulator
MTEGTDGLDRRLIASLREDARRPVAALAAELGVSRATVRARIDRLVRTGVICGFTIAVRDEASGLLVRAIMLIKIEGKTADKVLKELRGYPEVRKLHTTNGHWDVVAELSTDTLAAFDRLLSRIRQIDGIASTETNLLLSSPKETV